MITCWKRSAAVVLAALLLAPFACAGASVVGYDYSYTYNYDYWGDLRESPDAYRVQTVIDSSTLGLELAMLNPQSLFVKDDTIYLCDTGNDRILILRKEEDSYSLERIVTAFSGGPEPHSFAAPQDVYVTDDGDVFICDTGNNRVLKLDKEFNFLLAFTQPDDPTFHQDQAFLPMRMAADRKGRAFVLVQNVNKGLVKYEDDGQFAGFIGASPVTYTFYDQIWRVLSTREQRAQQEAFVPTEYDNLYMDRDGFIYVTTTTFDENDLMWDNAKPIRRLNAIGNDILVKNGEFPPIGDIQWDTYSGYAGPSKLIDITVLHNDVYVAADQVRGRLFGYDDQGRNLWAFGGAGNRDGYFRQIASLEHMGYDLLVLDALERSITVFTPTVYGAAIYEALETYAVGDYERSAQSWQEVLTYNGNYELAYIGIGRALLRQEQYQSAMAYFKLANDEVNYSKAFQEYRKLWVERNIIWLLAALFLVLAVPLGLSRLGKIRTEVNEHEKR